MSKINCSYYFNPCSQKYKEIDQKFKQLKPEKKCLVIVATIFAALASFFMGGLGGLATFRTLVNKWTKVEKLDSTSAKVNQIKNPAPPQENIEAKSVEEPLATEQVADVFSNPKEVLLNELLVIKDIVNQLFQEIESPEIQKGLEEYFDKFFINVSSAEELFENIKNYEKLFIGVLKELHSHELRILIEKFPHLPMIRYSLFARDFEKIYQLEDQSVRKDAYFKYAQTEILPVNAKLAVEMIFDCYMDISTNECLEFIKIMVQGGYFEEALEFLRKLPFEALSKEEREMASLFQLYLDKGIIVFMDMIRGNPDLKRIFIHNENFNHIGAGLIFREEHDYSAMFDKFLDEMGI